MSINAQRIRGGWDRMAILTPNPIDQETGRYSESGGRKVDAPVKNITRKRLGIAHENRDLSHSTREIWE